MSRSKAKIHQDFLSWDGDLDLSQLFDGEYTDQYYDDSDSEFESEKCGSSIPKTASATLSGYMCPHCAKVLKTISGFRGHVTKQHNDNTTRASDCKAGGSTPRDTPTVVTLTEEEFNKAFCTCVEEIQNDPINQMDKRISDVCENVKGNKCVEGFFFEEMKNIVTYSNISLGQDREKMFSKLHGLRLNESVRRDLCDILKMCPEQSVEDFFQIFSLEIIGHIMKHKISTEKERSTKTAELSDNDQGIIYYITGYIPKALKKRYIKIKNEEKKNIKIKCVEQMLLKSGGQNVCNKFAKWTDKISRGGLNHPNDNSFLLVREMENILRKEVDTENLSAQALLKDPLKETILSSFMVNFYTEKLFSCVTDKYLNIAEDIVTLFLTVRGFATTRLVRRQLKFSKTKSVSLRGGLKSKNKK